jgi:copper chaperone NosL
MKRLLWFAFAIVSACTPGRPQAEPLRIGEDACAHCRMTIVSIDTAAQIVEPGAEPIMFDEIGCLQQFLAGTSLSDRAVVFVADHRSHEWVDARSAVFTRTSVPTPMSSGLLAHAGLASRDADPAAHGGTPIAVDAVLGSQAGGARP